MDGEPKFFSKRIKFWSLLNISKILIIMLITYSPPDTDWLFLPSIYEIDDNKCEGADDTYNWHVPMRYAFEHIGRGLPAVYT